MPSTTTTTTTTMGEADDDDYLLNDLSLGGVGDDSAFNDEVDGEDRVEGDRGVEGDGFRMMGAGEGFGSRVGAGAAAGTSSTEAKVSKADGLDLVDEPARRRKGGRISLFPIAQRSHDNSSSSNSNSSDPDSDQDHTPTHPDQPHDHTEQDTKLNKDQKLKESLWELKKMVGVFKGFEDSLRCGMEGNEVGHRSDRRVKVPGTLITSGGPHTMWKSNDTLVLALHSDWRSAHRIRIPYSILTSAC
jgi:hypothetical protein